MAELYVKPGNQEKGWNDPPQFSYGLQSQGSGSKRPPLTKRVPVPLEGSPQVPPQAFVSPTPPKMPPTSSTPPGPPPAGQTYSSPRTEVMKHSAILSDDECNIGVENVLGPLNHVLNCCRKTVWKQVCDDISRRLTTLEQMWKTEKLSLSVKKRMNVLVRELQAHNWDVADEIHRSLMVDYVNEVSQWMVGVKRLIAEARNLPLETLVIHKEEATAGQNFEASQ